MKVGFVNMSCTILCLINMIESIEVCGWPCATCSNGATCATCQTEDGLLSDLPCECDAKNLYRKIGNSCEKCPIGAYAVNGTCKTCHKLDPLCDICTSDRCSVCGPNSYLSEEKCLCDEGYKQNQVICKKDEVIDDETENETTGAANLTTETNEKTEENNSQARIIIYVCLAIVVLILVVIMICYLKRSSKKVEPLDENQKKETTTETIMSLNSAEKTNGEKILIVEDL